MFIWTEAHGLNGKGFLCRDDDVVCSICTEKLDRGLYCDSCGVFCHGGRAGCHVERLRPELSTLVYHCRACASSD